MGDALVELKVMPESPEVDFEALKAFCEEKALEKSSKDQVKIEEEPVAFGLKAIKIVFLVEEDEGGLDDFEDMLREHDDVRDAETLSVSRTL